MAKKILVIEDNFKHEEDARRFFRTQPDVEVTYASDYQRASEIMLSYDREAGKNTRGDIDGVISDIYFPLISEGECNQPEPIGVAVALQLSQVGVPFVLNTAGYHHGKKYEWINVLAMDQGWKIIDSSSDREKDADSKNWEAAYQSLEEKMK